MRVSALSWMQLEEYLSGDDRCVLPLGSTEQHAYISLATDAILAERVAVEAAEPLDVPVFPVLSYGVTPYFMAFPGTVTISPETYERFVVEVLTSLGRHGFRRILVVNGHGGNSPARPAAQAWAARGEGVELRWHDWWRAPRVRSAVEEIDASASHASWMETFPWTRVAGSEPPVGHKASVDLSMRDELSPGRLREALGDGSFGGFYGRSDEEMEHVWSAAVLEVRSRLTEGWQARPSLGASPESGGPPRSGTDGSRAEREGRGPS